MTDRPAAAVFEPGDGPWPTVEPYDARDGYPLHRIVWPTTGPPRARVAVLHGIQSHGGWYYGLGRRLAAAGFEAHFPDRRGSGANPRDRGHASSSPQLIDDVVRLLDDLRARRPAAPVAVAGISWGGKLAVVAAARFPDRLDALALIAPGLRAKVGVPVGRRLRIAAAYVFGFRRRRFPIPLADPALFTDEPDARAFIAADPLAIREATAGLLAASASLDRDAQRALPAVRVPTLLMLAGYDRIVDNAALRADFGRLGSPSKRLIDYPAAHHSPELDPDPLPGLYAGDFAAWLGEVLPPAGPAENRPSR